MTYVSPTTKPPRCNGTGAGVKHDSGKVQPRLVFNGFPRALMAVAEVSTFGAKKYTPGGWQTVPDGINRYEDAMYRHNLARQAGHEHDAESSLLHLAHEAWNVLAVLELTLRAEDEKLDAAYREDRFAGEEETHG